MLVFITNDYTELSREAARIIANALRKKPDLRLGLATGDTQLGMYRELVRMHREEHLDFSRVITFNLDEYIGLSAGHPQSFRAVMHASLFDHVNIPTETHAITSMKYAGNTNRQFSAQEELICKSSASAKMATSDSTSQRPAWPRALGQKPLRTEPSKIIATIFRRVKNRPQPQSPWASEQFWKRTEFFSSRPAQQKPKPLHLPSKAR
jgi:hypothetical protein